MRRASWIAIIVLTASCGGDSSDQDADDLTPDAGACTRPASERYLPLAVGASWTYDVSEPGVPAAAKTNTVEALEDVGDQKAGVQAFRVRTEKLSGYTLSWQEDRCTSVVRHREKSFDDDDALVSDQIYVPSKLRIDETAAHLAVGAQWTESYTEVENDPISGTDTTSKDEVWQVVATDVAVTVPAGTFSTIQLNKTTSGDADKTFWFALGVGKIKEQGEQLEELRSFTLP